MDADLKTLDQLSGSPSDKKYITLDSGSEISGYTKDYLERLCRLDKVECGTWAKNKGQFVVELNSLLRETHTLLISYEGLLFVDKKDVALPEKPVIPVVPPPTPVASTASSPAQTLSTQQPKPLPPQPTPPPAAVFPPQSSIGQTASWPTQTLSTQQPKPPATSPQAAPSSPVIFPQQSSVVQAPLPPASVQPLPPSPAPKPVPETVVIPVARATPKPAFSPPPPPPPPARPASRPAAYQDEWDSLLFSSAQDLPEKAPTPAEEPKKMSVETSAQESSSVATTEAPRLFETPSPYRPIKTSIDPSVHYDPAPLFPQLITRATPLAGIPPPSPAPQSPPVSASALPQITPSPAPSFSGVIRTPQEPLTTERGQVAPLLGEPVVNSAPKAPPPPPSIPEVGQVSPPVHITRIPLQTPVRPPVVIPHLIPPPTGPALPKIGEEHHLAIPGPHAIIKGVTENKFEPKQNSPQ